MGAKLNHWDVKFYSNDENKRVFLASFRSEKLADKFIQKYQYTGDFKRFEFDHYGLNDFVGNIELVPCNEKGFKTVMGYLEQAV